MELSRWLRLQDVRYDPSLPAFRFTFTRGVQVWLNMDYERVPALDTAIRFTWTEDGILRAEWPYVGKTYPVQWESGQWCLTEVPAELTAA